MSTTFLGISIEEARRVNASPPDYYGFPRSCLYSRQNRACGNSHWSWLVDMSESVVRLNLADLFIQYYAGTNQQWCHWKTVGIDSCVLRSGKESICGGSDACVISRYSMTIEHDLQVVDWMLGIQQRLSAPPTPMQHRILTPNAALTGNFGAQRKNCPSAALCYISFSKNSFHPDFVFMEIFLSITNVATLPNTTAHSSSLSRENMDKQKHL